MEWQGNSAWHLSQSTGAHSVSRGHREERRPHNLPDWEYLGGGVSILLLNPFTGPESRLELLLCLHRTRVQFLAPTLSSAQPPVISVFASEAAPLMSTAPPSTHPKHTPSLSSVFSGAQSPSQFSWLDASPHHLTDGEDSLNFAEPQPGPPSSALNACSADSCSLTAKHSPSCPIPTPS